MAIVGKIITLILEFLIALLIGAVAAPLGWFLLRVFGLVGFLVNLLGRALPFAGGAIIGAGVTTVAMSAILKAIGERHSVTLAVGALGGGIGGLASSVIFFPFMAFL
jgi:hypothetical protein